VTCLISRSCGGLETRSNSLCIRTFEQKVHVTHEMIREIGGFSKYPIIVAPNDIKYCLN